MFQKVKHHKFIKRYLPIFLSVFVFVFCFPGHAQASNISYGTVEDWDGVVTFADNTVQTFLDGNIVDYIGGSNNNNEVYKSRISYEGNVSNVMTIDGLFPGSTINGYLYIYGSATLLSPISALGNTLQGIQFSASGDTPDDVTFSFFKRSIENGIYNYAIKLSFNEYYCTSEFIDIPFTLNCQTSLNGTASSGVNSFFDALKYELTFSSDWAGEMWEYSDPRDTDSMDGYFAEQNTQIINQQTINNELMQQQIQQDHEDTLQQTDTLTNGYDNSIGAAASDKLDNSISDLNDMEDSLFGTVGVASEDYTDITNFFTNLQIVESFSFVRSLMESIFVAMGDFSVPFTVGFLFFILVKILGYQQFASGGDS